MYQHSHVIRSLPLLADILGKKYGIKVEIGGDVAKTNGTVIHLPSLPVEGDDLLPMIRGYIDHEAAHIRESDFSAVKGLIPLEVKITNTIEDWRVEKKLAAVYPGCAENFQWLIKHLFLDQAVAESAKASHPAMHILNWLLITVRSWDVQELEQEREYLRSVVETHFSGLPKALDSILLAIPGACDCTNDAVKFAQQLAAIIKQYLDDLEEHQGKSEESQGEHAEDHNADVQDSSSSPAERETREQSDSASSGAVSQLPTSPSSLPENDDAHLIESIKSLLSASSQELPADLDSLLQDAVADACAQAGGSVTVAQEDRKPLSPLTPQDKETVRQATTALRTRLQALLQSTRSVRNHNGYVGRLDMHKLHELSTGNAAIFLKKGIRSGINTAVHILLDASGSMDKDRRMTLACHACYAVASVLHAVRGVNLGVTVFPGNDGSQTVSPILRHGQNMHDWFLVLPTGGTPMDAALWWVWQKMYSLQEARKIVLVITDGAPNAYFDTQKAINALTDFGLEVYAVGIMEDSVLALFPQGNSRVIHDIRELAPAVFQVLHPALVGRKALS